MLAVLWGGLMGLGCSGDPRQQTESGGAAGLGGGGVTGAGGATPRAGEAGAFSGGRAGSANDGGGSANASGAAPAGASAGLGGSGAAGVANAGRSPEVTPEEIRDAAQAQCRPFCELLLSACPEIPEVNCLAGCRTQAELLYESQHCGAESLEVYRCINAEIEVADIQCSGPSYSGCVTEQTEFLECRAENP
jgi:hypothetical protein